MKEIPNRAPKYGFGDVLVGQTGFRGRVSMMFANYDAIVSTGIVDRDWFDIQKVKPSTKDQVFYHLVGDGAVLVGEQDAKRDQAEHADVRDLQLREYQAALRKVDSCCNCLAYDEKFKALDRGTAEEKCEDCQREKSRCDCIEKNEGNPWAPNKDYPEKPIEKRLCEKCGKDYCICHLIHPKETPKCKVPLHGTVAEACVHLCGHDLPCPYHR